MKKEIKEKVMQVKKTIIINTKGFYGVQIFYA